MRFFKEGRSEAGSDLCSARFTPSQPAWSSPCLGNGVYAAMAEVDGVRYPGILNIGRRPTVDNGSHISIEVHLVDFDQTIYGKQISIAICHFLRQESRFSGLEALKEQLEKDKQNALQLFAKNTCKIP